MHILHVVGARPNFMKAAPVLRALTALRGTKQTLVHTGQHYDANMSDVFFEQLGMPQPDINLEVGSGSHSRQTAEVMTRFEPVVRDHKPNLVLVYGDVNSTVAAALVCAKLLIPLGHVEAGLRSGQTYDPYPEEMNRRVTSLLAAWHYAPTPLAEANLRREGVPAERIVVTGNTIVDALHAIVARLDGNPTAPAPAVPLQQLAGRRLVLVTGHRRESFGEGLRNVCLALRDLAERHPDILITYPVHLNPAVQQPVREILADHRNVVLTAPLDYLPFVDLMRRAHLILTDSGGIQEEAPSFGVPVLVMRETTERPEAIAAGTAELVGTRREAIVAAADRLLTDRDAHARMRSAQNPFGDGAAAPRIAAHLAAVLAGR